MKATATIILLAICHIGMAQELANAASVVPPNDETASPFQTGLLALKAENFPEAIEALSRETALHPLNAKAWYYKGVARMENGDYATALQDLDRAIELAPKDGNALIRRASIHENAHDFELAKNDLNNVLRSNQAGPIAIHALMELGRLQLSMDDATSALTTYDRLVMIAPNDARAWYDRGMAFARTNDHPRALDDLAKAISIDGWMDQAYTAHAIELVHLGRKAEACPDLAKAKELGDESVDELISIYCE